MHSDSLPALVPYWFMASGHQGANFEIFDHGLLNSMREEQGLGTPWGPGCSEDWD